jgi:hypothetical protein
MRDPVLSNRAWQITALFMALVAVACEWSFSSSHSSSERDDEDQRALKEEALKMRVEPGASGSDSRSGVVAVRYEIRDGKRGAAGRRVRLLPEFRVAGDEEWRPATELRTTGSDGLRALSAGRERTFLWAAYLDLADGRGTSRSVELRLRAVHEDASRSGVPFGVAKARFAVDLAHADTAAGGPHLPRTDAAPYPVALHASGGDLWVAVAGHPCVERIDGSGRVTRVAGSGAQGDAPVLGAPGNVALPTPVDVGVQADGSVVFVADGVLHRVGPSSGITALEVSGAVRAIAVDPGSGDLLYVGDAGHVLSWRSPAAPLAVAGSNGTALAPADLTVGPRGIVYIADGARVLALERHTDETTLHVAMGPDGVVESAGDTIESVDVDPRGLLLVSFGDRVVIANPTGGAHRVLGEDLDPGRWMALPGNHDAVTAAAWGAEGTALLGVGSRVEAVNTGDTAVRVYGRAVPPGGAATVFDAAARAAQPLVAPRALHSRGSLVFVGDRSSVRVLNVGRGARTVAGIVVQPGSSALVAGGTVPGAGESALRGPRAVLTADTDRLLVADTGNDRVLLVNLTDPASGDTVSFGDVTVPARGTATILGGGSDLGHGAAPRRAALARPSGVAAAGDLLLVADTGHHRILALNTGTDDVVAGGVTVPSGRTATIYGVPRSRGMDDEPRTDREATSGDQRFTDAPGALAYDARGILFVAEHGNRRIRALHLGLPEQGDVQIAGVRLRPRDAATLATPEGAYDGLAFVPARDDAPPLLLFTDAERDTLWVLHLGAPDSSEPFALDAAGSVVLPGQCARLPCRAGPLCDEPLDDPAGVAVVRGRGGLLGVFVADTGGDRVLRAGALPTARTPEPGTAVPVPRPRRRR